MSRRPPREYVPYDAKPPFLVKRGASWYRFVDCYYSEHFGAYLSEYDWWYQGRNKKWYRHVNQYLSQEPKTANFDDGVYGEPHLASWYDSNKKTWPYTHSNEVKQ